VDPAMAQRLMQASTCAIVCVYHGYWVQGGREGGREREETAPELLRSAQHTHNVLPSVQKYTEVLRWKLYGSLRKTTKDCRMKAFRLPQCYYYSNRPPEYQDGKHKSGSGRSRRLALQLGEVPYFCWRSLPQVRRRERAGSTGAGGAADLRVM
jgi:hypothetical protein